MAALDQELADLRLSADERTGLLQTIDDEAAKLDDANPEQIDRVTRINALRRQAREAEKVGNLGAAADARAEAVRLADEGGDIIQRNSASTALQGVTITSTSSGKVLQNAFGRR